MTSNRSVSEMVCRMCDQPSDPALRARAGHICRSCWRAREAEKYRQRVAKQNKLAPDERTPRLGSLYKSHCPKGHPYSGDNLYISPQGDRICKTCREASQKLARKRHPLPPTSTLSEEQKRKARSRQATRRAIAKGILVRQPCEQCGEPEAHAHHDDYSRPLDVRWLCCKHHREWHERERRAAA